MLMAVMLIVIGYADTKAVRPVAIAEEANGRVSLLYELAPQSSGQQTQRVEDGAFDDWWQQAEINSSTGGLEISGDNPNGNGLVRRWGQCTVGRLSWNGNEYGWRIPANASWVEYYNIDVTGYESCDNIYVYVIACSRGGNAGPLMLINGDGEAKSNVGTSWAYRTMTRSGDALEWNSADNAIQIARTSTSTDTLGVGRIYVALSGVVPIQEVPEPFNLTSPTNGATNQPSLVQLRWDASARADEYEVYFDTNDPPSELIDIVTGTSISVSGLSPGTTYYWDICATNEAGGMWSWNGPFHFTTRALPGPFSLVSPANGSTNQPGSGVLTWGASSGATSYDVYWGTSNPPPYKENVSGTSTSYSGSPGQTYYWYVVARNAAGTRECNSRFYFSTLDVPGAFSLTSPPNAASNQSASGTLSWQSSSQATSYDVYWGTTNPPPFLRSVSFPSTDYSGSPSQTYYWYVVAKNAAGSRECNARFYFSTMSLPGAFNLVSPAHGATNQPVSGTLTWETSSGASSYDVYWGTSDPPSFLRNVNGTSTTYTGVPDQTYYWHVAAKNAAGEKMCNARFYYKTMALPGTFNLVSPAFGATNQPASGTLSWEASAGATSYDVYWGTSDPPPFKENVVGTSTSYVGDTNTTYFWHVAAKNAAGERMCNARFYFRTMALPGAFNLVSPAFGATGQPTSGTLTWETSSGATSYDIYWGTADPPPFKENVTGTSASYTGEPNTTYFWHVAAKNAAGERMCNARFYYATGSSAVEEPIAGNVVSTELRGSAPEPFRARTLIHFSLAKPSAVHLEMLDSDGRLVWVREDRLPAGHHSLAWNGRDASGNLAPPGIYFCRMSAGDYATSRKLVKVE